jgi:hypothetical protein
MAAPHIRVLLVCFHHATGIAKCKGLGHRVIALCKAKAAIWLAVI